MNISWVKSLYGRLGLVMVLFAAVSALLVGSSFVALERVRSDVATTSYIGKERVFYQLLYMVGRLPDRNDRGWTAAAAALRNLMDRNEQMLGRLIEGDDLLGMSAQTDPEVIAQLEQIRRLWADEVQPALEDAIAQAPPSDAAMDDLDRLMRAYADQVNAEIDLIERDAANRLRQAQYLQLAFSAAALIVLAIVLWVGRDIVSRTRGLARTAEKVSAGDLERKAAEQGSDELALLGSSFNAMTAKLAGMIDNERADRERLEELLATISQTAQHLSSSAAEILAGTTQQVASMREQSSAVAETVTSVDEVLQTSEQAAQRAQVVASSSETAVKVSSAGRKAVDDTVSVMNAVSERAEAIAGDILSLAENSQEIGEIVAAVTDIAEQTNLLALNAAIEASRAGEHGRGFSVVATEIRALADQSKTATGRVRRILVEIQKATNAAVIGTEEGAKSVSRALETVNEAGETIRQLEEIIADSARSAAQIAASAGQQRTGMQQIHDAMHHIEQASSQNLTAIRQAEQAAKDLNELGTRLKDMLAGYRT
jgi:methyl-accepting chemotaxis protein